MERSEEGVTDMIQSVALAVSAFVQKIPGLDLLFVAVALFLLYKFITYFSSDKD